MNTKADNNNIKYMEILTAGNIGRGIVEAIGDAVSIQDTSYRILYQNKKAMDIIGDHTGEYCYAAYENNKSVCKDCPLEKSFLNGDVQTMERESTVVKPALTVEITTSVIRDEDGKIIAGIEVVRDITERKRIERERGKLIIELAKAITKVKTLTGLLPICASCKKIRDDDGYWRQVEDYIGRHTEAEFTHGYCPECARVMFPSVYNKRKQ